MKGPTKRILFWMHNFNLKVEQTDNFTRFEQVECTMYVSYFFYLILIDWEFSKKITGTAHLLRINTENNK